MFPAMQVGWELTMGHCIWKSREISAFIRINLLFVCLSGLWYSSMVGFDAHANANTEASSPLVTVKKAERISAILTGRPLVQEARDQILKGNLDLDTLTDQILESEAFVRHSGVFWSRLLGVSGQVSLFNQKEIYGNQTLFTRIRGPGRNFPIGPNNRQPNEEKLKEWIGILQNVKEGGASLMLSGVGVCKDFLLLQSGVVNMNHLNSIINNQKYHDANILLANLETWRQLRTLAIEFAPGCDRLHLVVDVQPSWAELGPGAPRWKAAKALVSEGACGLTFDRCFSNNRGLMVPDIETKQDLNLEPGYLVGRTIAEDLPQPSILTTTKTVLSGRLGAVLQKYFDEYSLWEEFPGGRFPPQESPAWADPSWSDTSLSWVERGGEHAGVLTTYAYQVSANGRRAKANRPYEALTCSKFVVPEGIRPDPSDDNPDLMKRAYCAACHVTLEPMAAFFNRWPETGRTNYEFDTSEEIEDRGRFRGEDGIGIREFGRILSESPRFDDCQIQRAWEFVMGRTWKPSERSAHLESLKSAYSENGKRLKPVFKRLVREVVP